jgi:hypothetical protein
VNWPGAGFFTAVLERYPDGLLGATTLRAGSRDEAMTDLPTRGGKERR